MAQCVNQQSYKDLYLVQKQTKDSAAAASVTSLPLKGNGKRMAGWSSC
jgi:hypothetical protein